MRISVALINCPTEHTIWSSNFDRSEKNLFDIHDEITRLIVGNIEPEFLRHEVWKAALSRPRNLDSWELLMRALAFLAPHKMAHGSSYGEYRKGAATRAWQLASTRFCPFAT